MRFWIPLALLALLSGDAIAQPQGPPEHLRKRGRAVEDMVATRGDDGLLRFADAELAPAYRDGFAPGKLLEHLAAIRSACGGNDAVMWRPGGDNALMIVFTRGGADTPLLVKVEPDEPHRIVALELKPARDAKPRLEVAPIAWENLEARLAEEAGRGFAGTVLVVRGGAVVLHRGYGMANRERSIANGTETIFAIGSTPIDFTRGAILKLEEMGKLKTSDPITKYVTGVPADKQAITIDHLMTGASGLPDFHHVEGVDKDYDLSWIDRDEAVRRILGQRLLFEPGSADEHSHSAWVLLAAIVEITSGKSYGDFLRTTFFVPAGMARTGLHEDAAAFPDDAFAVGYEGTPVGEPNIPKHWGRTSWLVMGSGGMQSNPGDLQRWMESIRSGKLLGPAAANKYWRNAIAMGGDDRGFMCLFNENEKDYMILCSNAHSGMGDQAAGVGRRLLEMVLGRSLPGR